MKIAITGGSGGIGSAVGTLALAQGHQVVSIDRQLPLQTPGQPDASGQPGLRFVQADMADYDALEAALRGCDALVHLAAIPAPGSHPDHVVHNNNVVGSYNALRAAAAVGILRVCQASSVNAVGISYSRHPRYDYLPIDEQHPTYNEDPYSLSKWICEQQGDSFARRYENMVIASLRFHWVVPDRATATRFYAEDDGDPRKHLFAYTLREAAARACLLALRADFAGHEAFYIVAPTTASERPTLELAGEFLPEVPITGDLSGKRAFFNSAKAEHLLGWRHDA